MKKITFFMAFLFAISYLGMSQTGWDQNDSNLPTGKGIGQISVGISDGNAMWCLPVNGDGTIYDAFTRSTDGGETWEAGTFNAGSGLSQLFAIDATTCWAVFNTGSDQGLYKTTDGGTTWVKKGGAYGSGSFANVIHFFNDLDGFAQGDAIDGYYELYTTTDGGETWTRVPEADIPAPTAGEYGITGNYCAFGDNIWWGTNKGRIFVSNDMGYTWDATLTAFGGDQTVAPLMFDDMNGIAFRSYLDLGVIDMLNVTDDGGATWTELVPSGAAFGRYFAHIPGTDNTLIGSASDEEAGMGISISEDGGATWEEITAGYPFQASVWFSETDGLVGTFTVGTPPEGGMYSYGNPPAPTNLQAVVGPWDDVDLTWNAPAAAGFADDFEGHEDFAIEFLPWTNLDVDGSTTYGMTDTDWPNAYDPQAFIIFNPLQTLPPVEDIIPHSGDKLAACFASTAPPNNDWMITPMTGIEAGYSVSFWAKSYTDAYGLERFKVGVSTTGMNPGDFTIISPGDYVEAPVDDWTEFSYDLSAYAGQSVYVGIQCVSHDAFILLVDDFSVGASKSTFAFNNTTPVNGKGTKDISYTAKPSTPSVTPVVENRGVASELLGYNVYRDDAMINASIVEVTEYNDPEPTIGSHDYFVTAVYSGGESDPSNVVSVVVTDIEDVDNNMIAVYPNPASDKLSITGENVTNVRISSITGQTVLVEEVNGNKTSIDVSRLNSGVYFVVIDTQLGSVTRKIIVE